ncbi:MAG: EAL domain-containing protein [Pseudomonadota bacterium]
MRLKFLHKLLILTVTPVLIAQAGTMLAVLQTSKQEIEAGAKQALRVGSAVAEQLVQTRNQQISRNVKLLASDFALKEVIAISDPESTRSALDNHANRIGADLSTFVYIDDDGESDRATSALERHVQRYALTVLDNDGALPDIFSIVLGKSVYQVYTAEMRAPTTIGYLMLGFRVGDNIAKPIRKLTDLNVAILQIGATGINTAVSTFDAAHSHVPPPDLLNKQLAANSVYPKLVGPDEFWVTHLPLTRADERVFIVLASQKLKPLQHFLKAKDNVLAFGVGLLVLVVALGAWLSAGVSRPLRSLASATRSLAKGEYETEIRVASRDEIGELAQGFEEMRKAVASRESQISHQLLHDPLTGLPNQKHTIAVLEREIDSQAVTEVSLIVIKMQSLDRIGSSLGLHSTDELTRETARTIASVAGDGYFVACIDTNRFAVACCNTDLATAQALARDITDQLDLGTQLGSTRITLKSHAGVAHYPSHTTSAEDLIRYAMIASVDAKGKKLRLDTYDTGREADFTRYLKIVQDLPTAVEHEELKVFFQPKVSIASGELYGAEALVRWQHAELGFLPPDDFISAAERSDNIKLLTRYVIQKAIAAARQWQDDGFTLKVAVNLSARDLLDRDLFGYVTEVLEQHDVPTTRLILEITESSVMEELDLAVETLNTFRAAGILVSIDDFGTGHSSLAQLRDLPLDELKIDKSFVSQISADSDDELLISTTIELAHGMGLTVVAEGIEDEYSLRRLKHHKCEIAQGYFFSKPLPEDDFRRWMADYRPADYTERRSETRPFSPPQPSQAAPDTPGQMKKRP